jgi:hypothetical protein
MLNGHEMHVSFLKIYEIYIPKTLCICYSIRHLYALRCLRARTRERGWTAIATGLDEL